MSFGLHDKDWVDPEPEEDKCGDCNKWEQCPCGCDWGVCLDFGTYTEKDDGC